MDNWFYNIYGLRSSCDGVFECAQGSREPRKYLSLPRNSFYSKRVARVIHFFGNCLHVEVDMKYVWPIPHAHGMHIAITMFQYFIR